MSKCTECGGEVFVKALLSGEEGALIYKYYPENDTVEHYARYDLSCRECAGCSQKDLPVLIAREGGGDPKTLADTLAGEGIAFGRCPECGGRLIKDMAGMGSAGNLLKKFAAQGFPYSFALFDLCADCGRIYDVREKLMGV